MRAALYNLAPEEYLHHTSIVFLAVPSLPDASQHTMASAKKIPARPALAAPRLPAELTEDAPTYMISSNHGLTAHVGFWNARPLLQLHARAQDRNGAPLSILVTLAELDALERDISRVETLLNEHNTRMHAGQARLLFRQLSTPDSGRLRHLEVSRWQDYVRASVRRFFINPQGDLYPTKDGIQYNVDKLGILRQLIPLIRKDFATAAQNADQMGAQEQETMDLILAHERELQAEHTRQRDPRLHGRDEVSSHADSPRAGLPPPLLAGASSLVRL